MRKIKELYEIVCALTALCGRTADWVCERIGGYLERHQRLCVISAIVCYFVACALE